MKKGSETSPSRGFCRRLIRAWFALTRRRIRVLQAGQMTMEGPVVLAVGHPAGFLPALVLATAMERPVRCLLPANLARGPLARFLARRLGIILEDGKPDSEEARQEVIGVLAGAGALVVFAEPGPAGQTGPGALARTAASLVWRAKEQHAGRPAVHPVHLFLPPSKTRPREILVYVDTPVNRPEDLTAAPSPDAGPQPFVTELEARLRENAFQLQPADLEYLLADLEEVLRAGLQEDWASRPDWKQDVEGFVLSRLAVEWARETNYLDPGRLVTIRQALDDYRRRRKQCALRELEVKEAESRLRSGRRAIAWVEMLLGLPVALYGLLNHLLIGAVLLLARSFKQDHARTRTTEWALRGAVALAFYALQIYLVAHRWGRAAAGYYAPTLPLSGAYLWRYAGLLRSQARGLFISLTIPALSRKTLRLRNRLLEELDRTLRAYEERTSVAR